MSVDTINGNHRAVWRPEHDFGRTHSLQSGLPLTLENTLLQVQFDRPQEVADYDGNPSLQQEIIESIARRRFAVQSTEQAARRLAGIGTVTPLVVARGLSEATGNACSVKLENEQKTGSFKLRGAFNMIASLPSWQRARGVAAASAGNHAQGVGFAAHHFGVPATIFMPWNTPDVKIDAVKELGATVILEGETFDEASAHCQTFLQELGADAPMFVPAFDHPLVIAGQGTVGKEILEQDPETEYIVLQAGGGGYAGGVAQYVKSVRPDIQIIVVEPEGSNALQLSRHLGIRVMLSSVETIAEGLAVRQAGKHTLELAQRYVDDIITVSEAEIMAAMGEMQGDIGVRAEPSGAAGWAGVRRLRLTGKKVVTVCTGGNIAKERFAQLAV